MEDSCVRFENEAKFQTLLTFSPLSPPRNSPYRSRDTSNQRCKVSQGAPIFGVAESQHVDLRKVSLRGRRGSKDLRGGYVPSLIRHWLGSFMGPSLGLLRKSGGAGERAYSRLRAVPPSRENANPKIVPRERTYTSS